MIAGPPRARTVASRSLTTALLIAWVVVLVGCGVPPEPLPLRPFAPAPVHEVRGGDPEAGRQAIHAYGCGACHVIPGVAGARGQVGPPLAGIANRAIIAGQLANTPENMIRWVRNPPEVEPGTAMPDMGVSASEARHIAAYLYLLR